MYSIGVSTDPRRLSFEFPHGGGEAPWKLVAGVQTAFEAGVELKSDMLAKDDRREPACEEMKLCCRDIDVLPKLLPKPECVLDTVLNKGGEGL